MRCQVGKKHLLFTYIAIIFSLMGVIFFHIGLTKSANISFGVHPPSSSALGIGLKTPLVNF